MKLRSWQLQILLNLFPPFLINRIRVTHIQPDFHSAKVLIKHSLFNRNFNKSIFGGSLFSAGDPMQALLYWQALEHSGRKVNVWLKEATIRYYRPAIEDCTIEYHLTDEDLKCVLEDLNTHGRSDRVHESKIMSKSGVVVAAMRNVVHVQRVEGKRL